MVSKAIEEKREGFSASSSSSSPVAVKEEGCNCRKNKCQTLHCACLKRAALCTAACRCFGCANTAELRQDLNQYLDLDVSGAPSVAMQIRGCRCPRSHCLQKHCGCFKAGLPCGEHCRCVDCKNSHSRGLSVKERNAAVVSAAAEYGEEIVGTALELEDEGEERVPGVVEGRTMQPPAAAMVVLENKDGQQVYAI
jgi:hypothetical protein